MFNEFCGKHLEWWYINLSFREDRNIHAVEQFGAQGIIPHRFEARLPSEWNGHPSAVRRMQNRTPGAIGCYMSQLEIIKSCPEDSVTAVCEDDVIFAPDMEKRLRYAEQALPEDWDIFYLGATFHVPGLWWYHRDCRTWKHKRTDAEPTSDKHIMRVYGQWGTYAYLVNGKNAKKVSDLLEENCEKSDGIDHNFIRLGDRVNAYCFVPGMAWQYDNESNIGDGITVFSNYHKSLGPYAWAERMEDFDPATYDWNQGGQK